MAAIEGMRDRTVTISGMSKTFGVTGWRIGTMTASQMIASFRTGKHWKTGQDIMPPMPIQAFKNLSDEDLTALHSFLMTLPPIKNEVPQSMPAGKA